jgi:hypothetical protein
MNLKTEKFIDEDEWNKLVVDTYKKPYVFQQQNGCQEKGIFYITIPQEDTDFENETVPEIVNHSEMGVKFESWLKRDPLTPLTPLANDNTINSLNLWWMRNFYPDIQMVANDLHAKGLIEAGEYGIIIEW